MELLWGARAQGLGTKRGKQWVVLPSVSADCCRGPLRCEERFDRGSLGPSRRRGQPQVQAQSEVPGLAEAGSLHVKETQPFAKGGTAQVPGEQSSTEVRRACVGQAHFGT